MPIYYDPDMGPRIAEYMSLLWQALAVQNVRQANGAYRWPVAFRVGRHPWSVPWPLFDRLDGLRGAVGYRPGLTIDIHAYAYRALPPANLVSCRELCRYRWERRETGIGAELVRILRQELLPRLHETRQTGFPGSAFWSILNCRPNETETEHAYLGSLSRL